MVDVAMRILIQAQNQASSVIKSVGGDIARLNPAMGGVVIGGLAIGAALTTVGVVSGKMAGDFEQAMLSNVAHAGLAKDQVNQVSQAILNMGPAVGRSPTQLAEAMYPILSSFSDMQNQGAKTALSLQTLKLSFETVAGTTTDGTAVANTAVSVFHALGLATNDTATNARRMNDLFDLMDKSVQDGNMSWDAYRGTIGKVALAIQGTKISFTEANAALDVMTASGFPSARQAGISLSNLFTEMVIKQDTVAAKAKSLKLAFNGQAFDAMNLSQRIAYLNKVTGGNQAEILKMLSGSKAARQAFIALENNTGKYAATLKDLGHSQGALQSSFDTASKGFNFAMSQAKAAIDVLLIGIGTQLLPIFTQLVGAVAPAVVWFMSFAQAVTQNEVAMAFLKGALVGFAVVVAALIIPALWAWASAAVAAAIAQLALIWPILLIGAVIAVVVAGIILAVKHWGAITDWLKGVWTAFSTWVGHIFSAIGTTIHNALTWITTHAKQIMAILFVILTGPIGLVALFIITHWTQIKNFLAAAWDWIVSKARGLRDGLVSVFTDMWNGIVSVFKGGVNFVIDILNTLIGGLDKMGIDIGPIHIHPNIPQIPHLATGGYVESSGLAMIHRGEQIIPARTSALGSGGGGGGNVFNIGPIYANSKSDADAIAHKVLEVLSRELLRGGNMTTWTSGGHAM